MRPRLLLALALTGSVLAFPVMAQTGAATATMTDLTGATLGTLTLTEAEGGVQISGELTGVPNGEHGFHIHETGTCDAEGKFESAGPHYNPAGNQHGHDNPEGPHAGDMQNITADDDGRAVVDVTNAMVTLGEGDNSLNDADGSALMIHADADDHTTDPGGNSGGRIACGIIEFAQ